MLGKLLPVLLALVGLGAGVGAGLYLKPDHAKTAMVENTCDKGEECGQDKNDEAEDKGDLNHEYVKLNNQFVVPVVLKDRVESLVALSLSVEVGHRPTGRGLCPRAETEGRISSGSFRPRQHGRVSRCVHQFEQHGYSARRIA